MTQPNMLTFERLDLEQVLLASREMADHAIIADFRHLCWVEPFPMLYLASLLRGRADTPIIEAVTAEAYSYASFMGFFRALGLHNEPVAEAPTNKERYAPIARLDVASLLKTAREQRRDPAELLTNRAGNLAQILTQQVSGPAFTIVRYAIRELLRNVIDHSGAQDCWYCAQAWPERRTVEVAILDEGRGVLESLRHNQHFEVADDEAALKLALLPGITGAPRSQGKNHFMNSGYGLYVTRKLCTQGCGSFFVCSMSAGVFTNSSEFSVLPTCFKGTAVRLRFDLSILADEPNLIDRIVAEGEREARTAAGPRTTVASPASRGLDDG